MSDPLEFWQQVADGKILQGLTSPADRAHLKKLCDQLTQANAEIERLRWPLSEASKQHYRRLFESIDECQDFYCGYAKKLTAQVDMLRTALVGLIEGVQNPTRVDFFDYYNKAREALQKLEGK